MPTVTDITEQKRRPNRRSVFLDGRFAFGCNVNVIAKFRLQNGMSLTTAEVEQIEQGEVRQECFDRAVKYLSQRLHGREELRRKIGRRDYPSDVVEAVLDDLERLGYVDDAKFAAAKAADAAGHKKHGPRRAALELRKVGIDQATVEKAVDAVYEDADSLSVARELAEKKAPALRRLDPAVAKRRLYGMLLRRGFEYETVKPVVDEVLGAD